MQDAVFLRLRTKVQEIIKGYSNKERECNFKDETFSLEKPDDIKIIGEYNAIILLSKDTGKKALFYCYYIPQKERWEYFVPLAGHVMDSHTREHYVSVEQHNGQVMMRRAA